MSDFRKGSSRKLEHLGDTTVGVQRDDVAISGYMNVMSLNPSPRGYYIVGNEVYVDTGPRQQVVDDESQVNQFAFWRSILLIYAGSLLLKVGRLWHWGQCDDGFLV